MIKFFKYWYNRLFSNVRHKYRFVVMNENLQARFSFRLSRMNVFIAGGMIFIILVFGTIFLIAFTSLREYIPGYARQDVIQLAYENQLKIDSLENQLKNQDAFLYAINIAFTGQVPINQVDNTRDSLSDYQNIPYVRSEADEALRAQIETGEKYNLPGVLSFEESPSPTEKRTTYQGTELVMSRKPNTLYYVPLQGTILKDFNAEDEHYGVDITGDKNDVIKVIQNGTVIASEWTPDAMYMITVQHDDNIRSVYKHNSDILKRVGDYVRAGEPIGFIGTMAEGYKGPILHFELWYGDTPVNPRDYVPF